MTCEFSDKERDLFVFFGLSNLIDYIEPVTLYQMCVEKAFLDDIQGPYVDSLRRCYKALRNCSVYRMTQEWDEMIQTG
jgi:hypothetical protein